MASSDRLQRLLRIVQLLQSGRRYNTAELSRLCGVSRRTIFRDLNTLRDSGIDIHYDERERGFSLAGANYVPAMDFTLHESLCLLVLCQELGQGGHGIPFQEAGGSAALKIASALPPRVRDYVGDVGQAISIEVEPTSVREESRAIHELFVEALARRQRVRIRYRSLTPKKELRTLVSPYRLHFSRRSWYVIGRSSLHRGVRTFNLARVLEAEMVDSGYEIPPRFSLKKFFGNAWNMINDADDECEVVVRFQPLVADNVAEVRWHETQELVWNDDGTLDFHVTVSGIREIVWWVLGYGDQAEVLAPKRLRNEVRRHVRAMAEQYGA